MKSANRNLRYRKNRAAISARVSPKLARIYRFILRAGSPRHLLRAPRYSNTNLSVTVDRRKEPGIAFIHALASARLARASVGYSHCRAA